MLSRGVFPVFHCLDQLMWDSLFFVDEKKPRKAPSSRVLMCNDIFTDVAFFTDL